MSHDSDSWEPELLESQLHGIDPENDTGEVQVQEPPAQRGRRALPIMWSRVILISEDQDADIGVHEIARDLAAVATLPRPPPARRSGDWSPIFLPSEYSKAHPDISMQTYRLGERRLKTLGQEICAHRARIRSLALAYDKSMAQDQEKELHEVSALA